MNYILCIIITTSFMLTGCNPDASDEGRDYNRRNDPFEFLYSETAVTHVDGDSGRMIIYHYREKTTNVCYRFFSRDGHSLAGPQQEVCHQ